MSSSVKETRWLPTSIPNLLKNRQSGNYYGRVKVAGKQKWRSLETTVLAVAKLRLRDFEDEVKGAVNRIAAVDSGQMTVGDAIAVYEDAVKADHRLKARSKEFRLRFIRLLDRTWPELRLADIRRVSESDCREWLRKLTANGSQFVPNGGKHRRLSASHTTVNGAIDCVRRLFEIGVEKGAIYRNPAADLEKARVRAKKLELPSRAQFTQLVAAVRTAGSRQSRDCGDLVEGLVYSGARIGEAALLRWRHVDFEKGLITIPGEKSATSHRTIPMIPALRQLLERLHAERKPKPEDSIFRVHEAQKALTSAAEKAGCHRMTHHDLRHFFATLCIESGVDIPTISRWLGHADGGALAMRTYGHLRQEHSVEAAKKVRI